MKPFTFKETENLTKLFKTNCLIPNYFRSTEFYQMMKHYLTGEYISFICDQYKRNGENNPIFYPEILFEITMHQFQCPSINYIEDFVFSLLSHCKTVEVSGEKHYLIGKRDFSKYYKPHFIFYSEKHKKQTTKQLKNCIFQMLSGKTNKNQSVDIVLLGQLLCMDFSIKKTIKKMFKLFGTINGGKSKIFKDQLKRIVFFKLPKPEKDIEEQLEVLFTEKDCISFEEFCSSNVGKNLIISQTNLKKLEVEELKEEDKANFVSFAKDRNKVLRNVQFRSTDLFHKMNMCGYVSTFYLKRISDVMEKNPKLSAIEIQKILDEDHCDISKIEKEILENICNLARIDPEGAMNAKARENIVMKQKGFIECLYEDEKLLLMAIPKKIKRLQDELDGKGTWELSKSGKERIGKIKETMDDFYKKLKENSTKKKEKKRHLVLPYKLKIELKKDLLICYFNTCDIRNLKNTFLLDCYTEGMELFDIVNNKNSKYCLSDSAKDKNLFFITVDSTQSYSVLKYPKDLCEKKYGAFQEIANFVDIKEGLPDILENSFISLLFNLKSYLSFHWIQTFPKLTIFHWISIFVRKNENGEFQVFTIDQNNSAVPVKYLSDLGNKKLVTSYMVNKFLRRIESEFKNFQKYLIDEKYKDEKDMFSEELKNYSLTKQEQELFQKKEFLTKMKSNLIQSPIKFKTEENYLVFKIWKLWKLFKKNGTSRSHASLLKEIAELKAQLKNQKK